MACLAVGFLTAGFQRFMAAHVRRYAGAAGIHPSRVIGCPSRFRSFLEFRVGVRSEMPFFYAIPWAQGPNQLPCRPVPSKIHADGCPEPWFEGNL